MKRNDLYIGGALVAAILLLAAASSVFHRKAVVEAAGVQAPRFEVDPLWPKPLPHHWILGMTVGVSVDSQDHIWIVHRQGTPEPKEVLLSTKGALCCIPAPPVLEFDEEGNLLHAWGGPGKGYDWPVSNHGITVDYKGNVWIGGNKGINLPPPFQDNQILKFTQDGKFLMQIGKPASSKGNSDTENLKGPAKMFIDKNTNELYVADGYGNRRVIVFDADTGKFKRMWGAFGHKPEDVQLGAYNPDAPEAQQFRNPVHCAELANDGLLYVCDRTNDRIQVFKKDGTFVKERIIEKRTKGDGSVWDIAFSKDPEQKYIFLADGSNERIWVIERATLDIVTSFGDGGRQPGQFYAVHSIAADSKGNIFTTETYRGQRVQKFVYKGMAPVTTQDQGVVWPK